MFATSGKARKRQQHDRRWFTAPGVTPISSAARAKLRWRAAASNERRPTERWQPVPHLAPGVFLRDRGNVMPQIFCVNLNRLPRLNLRNIHTDAVSRIADP
jgi:hypothetical protein